MTEWNDTPSESPLAKDARHHPSRALHMLLKQMCHRLRVIDRAQVYIIDQIEGAPESLSLVKVERAELEHKTTHLLKQWFDACGLKDRSPSRDYEYDDRPSQSNININVENVLPKPSVISSRPSVFLTAKFRRLVLLIASLVAGTIVGVLWALKYFHVLQ